MTVRNFQSLFFYKELMTALSEWRYLQCLQNFYNKQKILEREENKTIFDSTLINIIIINIIRPSLRFLYWQELVKLGNQKL